LYLKTDVFTLCKQRLTHKDGGAAVDRLLCKQLPAATLPLWCEEGTYVILPIHRKSLSHWALAVIAFSNE